MTDQPPPPGNYPPPPEGGYPPPPPQHGGFAPPPPPPGGSYPPPPQQQGGYPPPPPPQGGGYPPPPLGDSAGYPPPGSYPSPGGYPPPGGGYPPPGYAAPGYPPVGGPGYGSAPFSIGEAFGWAWHKFTKNPAALIVPSLVYGLILGVVFGIMYGLMLALAPDTVSSYESYGDGYSYSASSNLGVASWVVFVIGMLVLMVISGAVLSAYLAGMLDIANGQPVSIGSFFKPRNVGAVIIASLIVGIAGVIGQMLCFLPGIVVAIFAIFVMPAAVDRNLSAFDAIAASIDVVKNNFVNALLVWLLTGVIFFVGSLVCGVGLLVAAPVAMLFEVYAWRRLSGGQVAPLTP